MGEFIHGDITGQIIGAALEVWKILGYGFLEKVYENALIEELRRKGIHVEQQFTISVMYKGTLIGQHVADLFIEGKVILELKAEKEYNPKHEAQLLNYLKATGTRVGMLLNFAERKCEWKRFVV